MNFLILAGIAAFIVLGALVLRFFQWVHQQDEIAEELLHQPSHVQDFVEKYS